MQTQTIERRVIIHPKSGAAVGEAPHDSKTQIAREVWKNLIILGLIVVMWALTGVAFKAGYDSSHSQSVSKPPAATAPLVVPGSRAEGHSGVGLSEDWTYVSNRSFDEGQ